jgi:hypothetical protein
MKKETYSSSLLILMVQVLVVLPVLAQVEHSDPGRSHLLLSPTARSLGSGQWKAGLRELVFPFVGVGVGDRVSLAGGRSVIPDQENQFTYLVPQVNVLRRPQAHVAVGTLAMRQDGGDWGGVAYSVGTFGADHRALTVGLGVPYNENGFKTAPVLMAGGDLALTSHLRLLAESLWLPDAEGSALVTGLGLRVHHRWVAVDGGVFTLSGKTFDDADTDLDMDWPLVPWLSVTFQQERRGR